MSWFGRDRQATVHRVSPERRTHRHSDRFNDHHTVARARHAMEARKSLSSSQLADPTFDLRRVLA